MSEESGASGSMWCSWRRENSLVEVAGPEVVVLDDEGHDAGLQLCHEGVLCNDAIYVRLSGCQVKCVEPGLHVATSSFLHGLTCETQQQLHHPLKAPHLEGLQRQ